MLGVHKALLMNTHNICFHEEIGNNILWMPLLYGAMGKSVFGACAETDSLPCLFTESIEYYRIY